MAAVPAYLEAPKVEDEWGLDELRTEVLRPLAQFTMLCGLLVFMVLSDGVRFASWLPAISLAAAGFVALRAFRRSSVAAAFVLIGALWLILTASIVIYPGAPLAPLYALIVLPTAILVRPRVSLLTGAGSLAALIWLDRTWPGLIAPSVFAVSLFMIVGTTLFSWLLVSTLRTALTWVWVAYQQAEERLLEARERQGELGRVTKSLNETLTSLEDLNRQLAEARAVAEEARRLKAEFAAAVSHELRTPLNLIIGFAEMLVLPRRGQAAVSLSDVVRRQLQTIYRNAYHISNLVDDILDLSQIDAQRLALHKEPVALGDVVGEAVAVVGDLVEDEGLALRVEMSPDVPPIYADSTRLRQVLINLVSNASRFTEEGSIGIRARREPHQVVVAVSDTGMGIPPNDLPHVFEEFRQFGDKRKGGSGLGLNICKRLIELHGGNMWAESVPGQGSVFSFSLPLIESVVTVSESPSLQRNLAAMANRPIQPTLAVVDREGRSKIIGRYLDTYRVEPVESVERAKKLLASGHASALLFCDFQDVEAWRAVQGDEPALHPVAFCPLRTTTSYARRELGVADYLVKPVTPAQLAAALRRVKGAKRRWRSIGIVEDHPEMAELLEEMIGGIHPGCKVWRAADGQEALALLGKCPPDVLLLDLVMPRFNGYELLHELRRDERLQGVPVIVISGAEDRDERIVAEMVGITRPGGMTVGEGMACLKRALNSLLIRSRDNDPD